MPKTGRYPKSPFRSKFEQTIAEYLDERKVKYKYEPFQMEYDKPLRKNRSYCGDCYSTNLVQSGWYIPDFVLSSGLIIEAKGRFTAADRRKMLAVRECHPDETIVMLFMRDNKIHKRSTTYYSDWCMEHDYDFAFKEPKEVWLK